MKNIRIVILNNTSMFHYWNAKQGIEVFIPIKSIYTWDSALKYSFKQLRNEISYARESMRDVDKLAKKSTNHVLKLLERKREIYADLIEESKKPESLHAHIGVEIEFICDQSQSHLRRKLAAAGIAQYLHLKTDGSVSGGNGECDGSCRDNCDCADCGDTHYCDDEPECNRRRRNYGGSSWEYREDCDDCRDAGNFGTIDDCDCGGEDEKGNAVCVGEHVLCVGHCPGHDCAGYDDHGNYDCSCECTCDGGGGHELAIVARKSKIAEIVRKACEVLKKEGAEINDTCGLHVHLDARRKDEKRMFANLVKSQKLLYSMVPRSRYRSNYCKPGTSKVMEDYGQRYYGINPLSYNEHKTIEVRIHSGTINAKKINNWIELLSKIAYSKSIPEVNKLTDLTEKVKLSDSLVTYIKDRVEKFSSEHGDYSIDTNDQRDQEELFAA